MFLNNQHKFKKKNNNNNLSFTCVEHLLDDEGHLALEHGVEQFDDENEATAENEE